MRWFCNRGHETVSIGSRVRVNDALIEIWTALILWKINLRAAKSWFESPSSEKVKVSSSNFIAAIFSPKMFISLSFLQPFRACEFPARILIGNFDNSLMRSEAVASLLKKWLYKVIRTKPIISMLSQFSWYWIESWLVVVYVNQLSFVSVC